METWYRIQRSEILRFDNTRITEEEFERSTDYYLFRGNLKTKKHSDWAEYYPTYIAARNRIIEILVRAVQTADLQIKHAEADKDKYERFLKELNPK